MKLRTGFILATVMVLCFLVSWLFFLDSGIVNEDDLYGNETRAIEILKELDKIPFVNIGVEDNFIPELCENRDGEWVDGFNECEFLSKDDCEIMGGEYFECESACRNNPDAEACIMMCVQVCKF